MVEIYKEGSIIEYSKKLLKKAHEGMFRDTGEPYYTHPEKVAAKLEEMLLPTRFKEPGEVAANLHDVVEDVDKYEVYTPYKDLFHIKDPSKIYINDLLQNYLEHNEDVCYIIDKLTFRKGSSYEEYMQNILSSSDFLGARMSLDVIALLLKLADRTVNCVPGEKLKKKDVLKDYKKLKKANVEQLKQFYKEKKVTDLFVSKNDFSYNEKLYFSAVKGRFNNKKAANALDNLLSYLPDIDELLFSNPERNNAGVGEGKIFDEEKVSKTIEECMINSLKIIEEVFAIDSLEFVHVLYKTAKCRGKNSVSKFMLRLKDHRLKIRESG